MGESSKKGLMQKNASAKKGDVGRSERTPRRDAAIPVCKKKNHEGAGESIYYFIKKNLTLRKKGGSFWGEESNAVLRGGGDGFRNGETAQRRSTKKHWGGEEGGTETSGKQEFSLVKDTERTVGSERRRSQVGGRGGKSS